MPTLETEATERALLGELLKKSLIELREMTDEKLSESKAYIESQVEELKSAVTNSINEVNSALPVIVNLGTVEAPDKKIVHSAFHKIAKILSSAKRKEKNIMLVGAAGGGKTHLVKSIADALKLQFYPMSVGLQTTKSDLLGFINAHGNYVTSPIREAYEKGGVLLLDEFDACHAGVVTILNSLLANGHCSFPDKIIDKNPNFVCICACNTFGRGGNVEYVGRNRLDAATLDRFIVVDVDYDKDLENILTDNKEWLKIVHKIRKNAEKQGIKIIISPRASMDGADLIDAGFSTEEALDMTVFKGVSSDVKTKLLQDVAIIDCSKLPIPKVGTAPKTSSRTAKSIYIDFDNKRYNVSITFPEFEFKIDEWGIVIGTDYSPVVANDTTTIYLNPKERCLEFYNYEFVYEFLAELKTFDNVEFKTLPFDLKFKILLDGEENIITLKRGRNEAL